LSNAREIDTANAYRISSNPYRRTIAGTTINAPNFLSKAEYSPFDGMRCKGAVAYTILNGEVVTQNGIVGSSNGRIVKGQ